MVLIKRLNGGALFRREDGTASAVNQPFSSRRQVAQRDSGDRSCDTNITPTTAPDWATESSKFVAALDPERLAELAAQLSVTAESLTTIGCGWADEADLRRLRCGGAGWNESYPDGAYSFPERDGSGRIVGITLRAPDGRKGAPAGSARGLVVPSTLANSPGPVLLVEGASDVAAAHSVGLVAVGRPSNASGAEQAAALLLGHDVLVLGERDQKESGSWPGRDGAVAVAEHLATEWRKPILWTLPPSDSKDLRAWLQGQVAAGLDLSDRSACVAAGEVLLKELRRSSQKIKPQPSAKVTDAELVVRLAHQKFRLGRTDGDQAFAVRNDGPNVALPFRRTSESLRAVLAREFRTVHKRTPSGTALADAMVALHGYALDQEVEAVHLRVAPLDGDRIVLDLGGSDGQAVLIGPGKWTCIDRSPVLFRRTRLTAVLPEPTRGGSVGDLRGLVNVNDESWLLALGWLIASFFPDIQHPILLIGGLQGVGKTTTAAYLSGIIDPSTVENHSAPRDVESWAVAANGCYALVLDNISSIGPAFSNMLCTAVTGAGLVRRKLFTDDDLSVLTLRRAIILTSIDTGALRGDLGDRLAIIDLAPISDDERKEERALRRKYAQMRPAILGAVLDLVSAVMKVLPSVSPAKLPRMADFGRVLAAIDIVLGTHSFDLYLAQRGRIAHEVVEGDVVGQAILAWMADGATWRGSAGDLLESLTPPKPPEGWPRSPRSMAGRIRHLVPALGRLGVEVTLPKATDKTREYVLQSTARTAQPPENGPGDPASGDSAWAVEEGVPPDRPANRPTGNTPGDPDNADPGRSGGLGGPFPELSGDEWGSV